MAILYYRKMVHNDSLEVSEAFRVLLFMNAVREIPSPDYRNISDSTPSVFRLVADIGEEDDMSGEKVGCCD